MALFRCCVAPKGPVKTVPLEPVSPATSAKIISSVDKQGCLVSLQFADKPNAAASETGVLIGPNLVLTSHDTLSSKEQAGRGEIQVVVSSGKEYLESRRLLPERVFLSDPEYDVTIVSCESTQGLQGIKALALEEALDVPEASIAIGSSFTIFGRPADVADLEGDRLAVVKGQGKIKVVDGPFLKFASNGEPWAPGSAAFDEQGRFVFLVCGPTESLNSASPKGKKSGAKARKGGLQSGTTARAIIHWVGEQGFKDLGALSTAASKQRKNSETVLLSEAINNTPLVGTDVGEAAVEQIVDPSESEGEPPSPTLPEERQLEEGSIDILEPKPLETGGTEDLLDEPKEHNEASVEAEAMTSAEAVKETVEAGAMTSAEAVKESEEAEAMTLVEAVKESVEAGTMTLAEAVKESGEAGTMTSAGAVKESVEAGAMIAETDLVGKSCTESAAVNADGNLTSVDASEGKCAQESSEAPCAEGSLAVEEKRVEETKQTETEQNKEEPTVEAESAPELKVGQAESDTASVTEGQSSAGLETNLKPVFVSRIPKPPSGKSSPKSDSKNSPKSKGSPKAAFLSSSAKPGAYERKVSGKEAKLIKHLQKQAKRAAAKPAANDGGSVKETVDEIERRTSSTEKDLTPEESSRAELQRGDKEVSKEAAAAGNVEGTSDEKKPKLDSYGICEPVKSEEATSQQEATLAMSPAKAESVGDKNETTKSEERKEESKEKEQDAGCDVTAASGAGLADDNMTDARDQPESGARGARDQAESEAKDARDQSECELIVARDQAESAAIMARDQAESEAKDARDQAEASGTGETRAETEKGEELPIGEDRLLQFSMSVAAAKESFEKLAKKETDPPKKKLSKQGSLGSQKGKATARGSSRSADETTRGSSRSADETTRGKGSLDTSPIGDERSKSKKTAAMGGKKPSLKPPPGLAWKSRAAKMEERKMSPSSSMKKNGVILGRGLIPIRSIDSKERTRGRGLSSQKTERTLSISDIDLDSDSEGEKETEAETEIEVEKVGAENGNMSADIKVSNPEGGAGKNSSEALNLSPEKTGQELSFVTEATSAVVMAQTEASSLNEKAEATGSEIAGTRTSSSAEKAGTTASSSKEATANSANETLASSANESVEATAISDGESIFTPPQQSTNESEASGENALQPEPLAVADIINEAGRRSADIRNGRGESSPDVSKGAGEGSADVAQVEGEITRKDADASTAKGDFGSALEASKDETAQIRRQRNSMPASLQKGIEASALLAGNRIEGFGRQTIDAPKPRARTTEDKVRDAQESLRTNVPVLGPVLGLGLEVGLRLEKKLKREEDLHGLKKASKFKVKKAAPTIVVPGGTTGQEVGGLSPQGRGREIRPGVYESAAQSPTSPAEPASPKFIPEVLVKVTQDISRGVKVVTDGVKDGVKAVTELPGIKEGLGIILEPIKKLEEEKKEVERKRLAEAAAKERAAQEEKQGRLDRLKVNDSNTAMRDIKASILGLDFGKKKRRLPGSEDPDLDADTEDDPEARAVHRANLERRILGSFSGLLASTETLTQLTSSEVEEKDSTKQEHEAGHVSHLWPGNVAAAGSWEKVPPRLHKYVRKTGEMTLQQQAELLWHTSQEAASDPYERLAGEEPDAAEKVSKGLGDSQVSKGLGVLPANQIEATKQVTKWQDEYWQARMAGFRHENAW